MDCGLKHGCMLYIYVLSRHELSQWVTHVTQEGKLSPLLCVTAKKDVKFGYYEGLYFIGATCVRVCMAIWHAGLTDSQRDVFESIQQRTLKIAFLSLDYEALISANMPSLYQHRQELCRRLFNSVQDPSNKLHPYCLILGPLPILIEIPPNTLYPSAI